MKKNEFLKKIRIDNGLSRSKIAKILDVSPVTIERYENNKTDFNASTKYIQGICALYGYNPEIFNYEEIDDNLIKKYKLSKKEAESKKEKIERNTLLYEIKRIS